MRFYALYLLVITLAVYAWRDWFLSLCGLILLTGIVQRKDFPSSVMGIQGMNPWNMLLAAILIAWLTHRSAEGKRWDMPKWGNYGIIAFVAVLTFAVGRTTIQFNAVAGAYGGSIISLLSEEWINPLKYFMVGILVFDGCRNPVNTRRALYAVLAVCLFWAVMTIRFIPLSTLVGGGDFMKYRYKLDRDIGLFATDLGMLFAGSFWATLALWPIWRERWRRLALLGVAGIFLVALGLTYARGGYLTLAGLGLIFGVLRWRWILMLMPVGAIATLFVMPNVGARLGMGFGETGITGQAEADLDEVTSGRTTYLWPNAIDEIMSRPLIGAGRMAILQTPMYHKVVEAAGSCPRHPHSAYLELLMDVGLLGFVPMMFVFGGITWVSMQLFRSRGDPLAHTAGAFGLSYTLMLCIAGIASQTFFGTQTSMVPLWITAAVALRVYTVRRQQRGRRRRTRIVTVTGSSPSASQVLANR